MARDFDGSADYLLVSGYPVSGYPFTFATWVNCDDFSTGPYFMQLGVSSLNTSRLGLAFNASGNLEASTRNNTNTRTWVTTAAASTGAWVHVVGTFSSSSTVQAYLNAVNTGSYIATSTVNFAAFDRLALGAMPRSTISNFLNGRMAESAVWNVTLSLSEIESLAAGYSPLSVRPQSLVAYWPLHGRNGASGGEEDWGGNYPLTQTSSPGLADHPRIIYPRRRTHVYVPSAAPSAPSITALSARLITATSAQPRISYS